MIQSNRWYTPSNNFGQYHAEILLYSFYGGIDAGDVGALVVEQLLSSLPHRSVAEFALENVLDYRSRRPRLVIENWHITDMQVPTCELLEITDYSGKKFLLLHGVEPDINWVDFSAAIVEVVKECGVEKAIDIMGVASNIPHTRMPFIHHTALEGVKLPEQSQAPGNFVFTATFGQYLQVGFQKAGISSRGMLVGVPYYLADSQFPPGSVSAVEFINKQFQLDLPLGDLAAASSHMQNELTRQIGGNEEISQMIAVLEQHYDKSTPNEWGNLPGGRIGVATHMADGDKIAERLEKFLRDVDLGKGGSGFKDMERHGAPTTPPTGPATPTNNRGTAPAVSPVIPAVPPVAPATPVGQPLRDSDRDIFESHPKVGSQMQNASSQSAPAGPDRDEKLCEENITDEMPPIFKQMYAEKNPYEIWNRPSAVPLPRLMSATKKPVVEKPNLPTPESPSPEIDASGKVANLKSLEDVSWVPRQRSATKRFPRRRPEVKDSEAQLYPWREKNI